MEKNMESNNIITIMKALELAARIPRNNRNMSRSAVDCYEQLTTRLHQEFAKLPADEVQQAEDSFSQFKRVNGYATTAFEKALLSANIEQNHHIIRLASKFLVLARNADLPSVPRGPSMGDRVLEIVTIVTVVSTVLSVSCLHLSLFLNHIELLLLSGLILSPVGFLGSLVMISRHFREGLICLTINVGITTFAFMVWGAYATV